VKSLWAHAQKMVLSNVFTNQETARVSQTLEKAIYVLLPPSRAGVCDTATFSHKVAEVRNNFDFRNH
jgi:hypothetical protein